MDITSYQMMEEKLYYLNRDKKKILIQEYSPSDKKRNECFIFFNPIFDEIHSTQNFYAECGRLLTKAGYNVVRFDYHCSGDSNGELFDFDFTQNIKDALYLCGYFKEKYQVPYINLFGLRMGADMSLLVTQECSFINKLILIEPIINGKKYIHEQRIRRNVFYRLNGIDNSYASIEINGEIYEDHQGYPMSKEMIGFIEELNMIMNSHITGKTIYLFKLKNVTSRKLMSELKEHLSRNNDVTYTNHASSDFWSTNQRTITLDLSRIVSSIVDKGL